MKHHISYLPSILRHFSNGQDYPLSLPTFAAFSSDYVIWAALGANSSPSFVVSNRIHFFPIYFPRGAFFFGVNRRAHPYLNTSTIFNSLFNFNHLSNVKIFFIVMNYLFCFQKTKQFLVEKQHIILDKSSVF